jgi:hypothetical protein
MQTCQHCGLGNREGVMFCEHCGVALVPIALSTRQLSDNGDLALNSDELGPEGVIVLQVGNFQAPIMVQIRDNVTLGRAGPQGNQTRYINLSPYGADEAGVSRQHLRLTRGGRAVYALDLNSTNGSKINGDPIPGGVECRITDGDELTLGRLKVYIYLK